MREHQPTGELAELLDRYQTCGGVIDYVLLDNDLELPENSLHALVAQFGMRVIQGRIAKQRNELKNSRTFQDRDFFQVIIDSRMQAKCWSETAAVFMQQYHQAFTLPPYPFYDIVRQERVSAMQIEALCRQINLLLFGDIIGWSIRRWSDDWSNYFDAGKEWWGAFLWTLVSSDRSHCIWIGASATD